MFKLILCVTYFGFTASYGYKINLLYFLTILLWIIIKAW